MLGGGSSTVSISRPDDEGATSASCRPELNRDPRTPRTRTRASISSRAAGHFPPSGTSTGKRTNPPVDTLISAKYRRWVTRANDALHRDPLAVLFSGDELLRANGPGGAAAHARARALEGDPRSARNRRR